jgi:hypothetical protein
LHDSVQRPSIDARDEVGAAWSDSAKHNVSMVHHRVIAFGRARPKSAFVMDSVLIVSPGYTGPENRSEIDRRPREAGNSHRGCKMACVTIPNLCESIVTTGYA